MTEQTQKLREALHGCAERGISPTTEPWTEIRARLDAREAAPSRRRPRFVPRTRVRLALAAALVLLFGMGAYAGFPMVYNVFREALPGGTGRNFGVEVGQQQTDDGAKVTLEYAYADAEFVVVGYTVQDTKDRTFGDLPSELSPLQIDDTDRTPKQEAAELPPRVNLTDESGQDFEMAEGSLTYGADDADDLAQPKPNVAIFKPSKGLEPGERHRFRLKVALEETPIFPRGWEGEIEAPDEKNDKVGPFAFDFEVPVQRVPVVGVDQKETAKGVTLTLERVLNYPGKPQAIVCFESPNENYLWRPSTAPTGFQFEEPLPVDRVKGGCWALTLENPVEGRSSVVVTEIWGDHKDNPARTQKVRGPWKFEFEAPGR